jgi:hypothetical protein
MSRREDRERRKQESIAKQRARLKADQSQSEKIPRAEKQDDSESKTVQWCFRLFDHSKDWRSGSIDHVGFCEVGGHFKDYSQRTWSEIRARGDRDHPISCGKLRTEVVNRLKELKLDDVDEIWSFHFSARSRLWGVKLGHIMQVLWWDPDHQVYPVEKKNT